MSNEQGIASAFGAKVTLSAPDHGLYLVMGRTDSVITEVRAAGGQLVMILPGGRNLLAMMPTVSYLYLKTTPHIAHIGPITIDEDRFNHFLRLVGLQQPG
ncbi:MAG: hypothetical protein U0452_08435 [Anaerolineae bacterium]